MNRFTLPFAAPLFKAIPFRPARHAIMPTILFGMLLARSFSGAGIPGAPATAFAQHRDREPIDWSGAVGYSSTVKDVRIEDMRKAIRIEGLQDRHPYLFFDAQGLEAIRERIAADPESNAIMKGLEAQAFKLLHQPVVYDIPVQSRNPRAGWTAEDRGEGYKRTAYEDHYRETSENALILAFVYQITGDPAYARKAYEFADAFSDLPSWTRRAHEFPIIYDRIWPWNVADDQVNFSFDHHNGDAARVMAMVYDWIYPAIDKRQRDRLRGALLEKAITRVRGHYEQHWWATAYRTNWAGVNHSGLGIAAMALLGEHPELIDVVTESHNGINKMLSELGEDGAWHEGGGYWAYGVVTSAYFADVLKRATGGRYDLFKNERLAANPTTFPIHITLPDGSSLNFQDSKGNRIGSTFLMNKIASETGDAHTAWFRDTFYGEGRQLFDLIWPRSGVTPVEPEHASIHFRTWDWWVMRSDFTDPDKMLLAGMAGKNNEPHHGHLSVGHIVLHWKGEYYLKDLGMQDYDQLYFNDVRWERYPEAMSIGHNVVSVNGEQQLSGKMKDQPWDHSIGGQVLEFRTDDRRDYILVDATDAYPNVELKGWRRHVIHLKDAQVSVVLDEVAARPGSEIAARYHPGVRAEIVSGSSVGGGAADGAGGAVGGAADGAGGAGSELRSSAGWVELRGQRGAIDLIAVSSAPVSIRGGKHAIQPVHGGKDMRFESYVDIVTAAGSGVTPMATVLLPSGQHDDVQASEARDDGRMPAVTLRQEKDRLVLEFDHRGKGHRFDFINTAGGWVWQEG